MYSVAEYAKLIGKTRQAVLKQINAGKVKAQKVGKAYVVMQEPPKKKRTNDKDNGLNERKP